jgi:hypothetical protein
MKAIVVPVTGPVQFKELTTLEDIKAALNGGWLECLRLKNNAVASTPTNPRP